MPPSTSLAPAPQTVAPPVAGNMMDRISEISEVETAEDTASPANTGSELVDKIEAADPTQNKPDGTKQDLLFVKIQYLMECDLYVW